MIRLTLSAIAMIVAGVLTWHVGENMTPENVRLLIVAGVSIVALLIVVAGLLLMNGQTNRDRHDERAARVAKERIDRRQHQAPPVIVVTPHNTQSLETPSARFIPESAAHVWNARYSKRDRVDQP